MVNTVCSVEHRWLIMTLCAKRVLIRPGKSLGNIVNSSLKDNIY